MKKHNGMRPHDVVILLKIAAKKGEDWLMKDLSHELGISASEISEGINRCVLSGLLGPDKKKLMKLALLDFLQFGLPYVFPLKPGHLVSGLATAHSAPPLKKNIVSKEHYVWPMINGKLRGQAIEPLHLNVPEACLKDAALYELMALCDALRVGKAREKEMAIHELKKRIC